MKASQITLEDIRALASGLPDLALAISFVQVEEGLDELAGMWDGFCDANNFFEQTFDDKRDCAIQFGIALRELIELEECAPR